MTTATIQLYEYSDLIKPEHREILDNIIKKWDQDHFYTYEIIQCVEQFCKDFGFKTGETYDHIIFPTNYDIEGLRLRTWIINNFNLWQPKKFYKRWEKQRKSKIIVKRTEGPGICYYMDLIDVIFDFLKNPTDMYDLCNDLSSKIAKMLEDEDEYTRSEEYILESIEANDFKFTEDGKIY